MIGAVQQNGSSLVDLVVRGTSGDFAGRAAAAPGRTGGYHGTSGAGVWGWLNVNSLGVRLSVGLGETWIYRSRWEYLLLGEGSVFPHAIRGGNLTFEELVVFGGGSTCARTVPASASHSWRRRMSDGGPLCAGRKKETVTWLILPVVICLSQRLSHACVSINSFVL